MPPLPALSGREVVRVFVAKGTLPSLIRAANVTVEELLATRQTRSRPASGRPALASSPSATPAPWA